MLNDDKKMKDKVSLKRKMFVNDLISVSYSKESTYKSLRSDQPQYVIVKHDTE